MSDERKPWRGGQWQQFWPEQPVGQEPAPGEADRQPEQGFDDDGETAGGFEPAGQSD